jgi:hypothetical protein
MHRILAAAFVCVIGSNAIAGGNQKLAERLNALADASSISLATAYACRDAVGVDMYLKVRKSVEIALVNTTKDANFTRRTIDRWENEAKNNSTHNDPDAMADKCADLLLDKLQKLKIAFDAVQEIQSTH